MAGIRLGVGDHRLEIQLHTAFTPVEIVKYDGKEMSRKSSWLGTTHQFDVTEEGQRARYEVKTFLSLRGAGCTVTRNGVPLYESF